MHLPTHYYHYRQGKTTVSVFFPRLTRIEQTSGSTSIRTVMAAPPQIHAASCTQLGNANIKLNNPTRMLGT
ncbi:MAG: hypothetical protein JKY31_05995 [Rhodobacteraceae bacterium]|nr:hypothetical protein [Paracoccaceae bacterium]